ncbi:MAG: exopolysaccharide biosynthesis polyprenyl glycosylphosphotransferase [Paramuribaculum sp.]|nr:exopolysaccharide biosynthesis polyprenyl glycosylphosphotransferase [Paramuribaculum sp.]
MKHFRSKGRNFRNVAIIGSNPTAIRLYDTFCTDAALGYKVVGFFDDVKSQDLAASGLYKGSISDLEDLMDRQPVDEIFFTLSADSGDEESAFISATRLADRHGIAFYYVPQMSRFLPRGFKLMEFGSLPVLSLRHNPLSSTINRTAKRSLDIAVASLALLVSPIILIPAGIAIKLSSPGPMFFRQKRTGYLGSEFECIKLRSMRVNDKADTLQASPDDPRTTPVGAFLRRTSLDEIPQFWNVLRGEMSVVGPRPHMLAHSQQYSELIDRYRARHIVKPGITGWAQVNGLRGETRQLWQMEKRVEYDVFYIENWTLLFDIKIICRTFLNSFHPVRNAF